MLESHFGESEPLTVGIEEELMILDAETLLPVAGVDLFVGESEAGRFKTELHASVVELNTGVCEDAACAVDALRALRAAALVIARENMLVLAGAGAHPTARFDALPIAQEPRYLEMIDRIGYAARRQGVCGLHVHVGVESAEACWERLEAVLPWLPVVLALSTNSPFLEGVATGMQSSRASILAELPRAGAPPAFESYAGWEAWVERLVGLGVLEDHTRIWWDVRPHPTFGTLEIRIADQPTSLARTALLAELTANLVATAPSASTPRGDYLQNRWAAARFGLDAELVHPDGDRVASARQIACDLLGGEPPVPEALRQLAVGVDAAAADLVDRTVV